MWSAKRGVPQLPAAGAVAQPPASSSLPRWQAAPLPRSIPLCWAAPHLDILVMTGAGLMQWYAILRLLCGCGGPPCKVAFCGGFGFCHSFGGKINQKVPAEKACRLFFLDMWGGTLLRNRMQGGYKFYIPRGEMEFLSAFSNFDAHTKIFFPSLSFTFFENS